MLPSRGAAWPALPVDTSALVAEETALRRKMHEEVLRENPDAFRRYVFRHFALTLVLISAVRQFSEDSLSSSMIQQIKMKDLIKDMHLTKDLKDIDRTKTGRYTFSRLTERLLRDKQNLDEYKFETMPPVEDFVRPDDTESRRNTGYDHGHVRSLMKLDIYGPAASRQSYRDRSVGKLPTNNVDKYAILDPKNPQFMATTGQFRGSTASTSGGSRVSSAASTESSDDVFPSSPARLHTSQSHDRQQYQQQQQQTMQSTNSSTDSKRMKIMMENITGTWNNNNKQIPSPSTASSTSTFDTTYSKSIKHFGDDPLLGTSGYQDPNELTIPVSLRKNTNNMGMTRISVDDRSQLDPFIRRKEWYDSYVTRNKVK